MSDRLQSILAPLAQANGLANEHYTDTQVHDIEKKALFFDTWAGLSVGSEIPEIGDARPVNFLGMPLLIIRDKVGDVRVFQNICRHRGMILVSKAQRIEGAIRCPYHSWCYSTEGRLITTPHVGGPGRNTHSEIDKTTLGLIEVRSHIWRDVIFINISGKSPPFETVHKHLIQRWKDFDQPMYQGGENSKFTINVKCNWKLAVENYCESYHLPWVHPGLNAYSRLEDHYHIQETGLYSGQGTNFYRQFEGTDGYKFPSFKKLDEKWGDSAEYITVFPNVLMACQKDHAWSAVLNPISHELTTEDINIYYASPTTNKEMRKVNKEQWEGIFIEDISVVEGMQLGRKCTGFDGGRFSPAMDGPTHLFHSWVANKLINNKDLKP